MYYEGTDLKFRVSAKIEGFSMDDNGFKVVITNSWGNILKDPNGEEYVIKKDNMFQDSEGMWYFLIENIKKGTYYAKFYAEIPDDDYTKQVRIITDKQKLFTVSDECQCGICVCGCDEDHSVQYEQVWTVNDDDGTYLADKDGNYILTEDGARIAFKR